MHPRNPYKTPPDFKELALKFPEFRKHAKQKLSGKIEIDFKDAAAVRALTTVLLKKDFNLEVELPTDRLVPTLPLRLNYLLWIEDLLELVQPKICEVHGIDIGTGACSIYPILAAKKNEWKFTATEADEINYEYSCKTLSHNGLEGYVNLLKVNPESLLLGNIKQEVDYDFTMCNPPFFDIDSRVPKSRTENRPEPMCPKAGGSTAASEIAVKGGEVAFVQQLVKESQELNKTIKVFTTMLGHKSSLNPLKTAIKEAGATSWTQTEFVQGRTMRWALAWTYFSTISLFQSTTKQNISRSLAKKSVPPFSFQIDKDTWISKGLTYSIPDIMLKIHEQLGELKMGVRKVSESRTRRAIEFTARKNTWSNQRRKRRQAEKNNNGAGGPPCHSDDQLPAFKKMKVLEKVEEEDEEFILKGILALGLDETSDDPENYTFTLQIQWIEGGQGRESVNQILQYLKNNLFR